MKLHSEGATGLKRMEGITRPSIAFFVANQLAKFPQKKSYLIVGSEWDEFIGLKDDLEFFLGGQQTVRVVPFPPFEESSVFDSIERTKCLWQLTQQKQEIVVVFTTITALQKKILPAEIFKRFILEINKGLVIEKYQLLNILNKMGYQNVVSVEDPGTYGSRGDIVDIFPAGGTLPVRIELFGDTVEEIRVFNFETQRSVKLIEQVSIYPCRDFVYPLVPYSLTSLKAYLSDQEIDRDAQVAIVHDFENEVFFQGMNDYLELFYPTESLLSYFSSDDSVCFLWDEFSAIQVAKKKRETYQKLPHNQMLQFIPSFEISNFKENTVLSQLNSLPGFTMGGLCIDSTQESEGLKIKSTDFYEQVLKKNSSQKLSEQYFEQVMTQIKQIAEEGVEITFVVHNELWANRLREILQAYDLHQTHAPKIVIGKLKNGFVAYDYRAGFITEQDIFGKKRKVRKSSRQVLGERITDFGELKTGDTVVHLHHGKGRYLGLQRLNFGNQGVENDYLVVEYKGGDKIYLPVYRLKLLQKYVGRGDEAGMDKLGSKVWQATKEKTKYAIFEIAAQLLKTEAARKKCFRKSYGEIEESFRELEATFPFEETDDQLSAISDIMVDLDKESPMDRLVCGDVGYGKTEVAIRAAFRVVLDGKQVAILAPTTVLCFQHMETFRRRLGGFAVRIEMLNRFVSKKDQTQTMVGLKSGGVDIVIGTHRLFSKDIQFKNLGLLIIDEEQKFGVKHKERIKEKQVGVDILTLSATPIPRTLHMSMLGLRDLSIITTPPVDRMAVKTYIVKYRESIIQNAIETELKRGGQVYFIHNRVENIGQMADLVQSVVPGAKVRYAHGQMAEEGLERIFIDFINQKFNVLVCTTIIESGLDIPNVNTIIVNRADNFGLSQLYQLKGRVGRSNKRAYAWLLIPGKEAVSAVAAQRLEIIQTYAELGSGFAIASHDMDIRGVGNLLGSKQSGQIAEVGFELYSSMLEEAVGELKGEKPKVDIEPEIEIGVQAFIPDTFIESPSLRLRYYKQIALLEEEESIEQMAQELEDRFGQVPMETTDLLRLIRVRNCAKRMGVVNLKKLPHFFELKFLSQTDMNREAIEAIVQKYPRRYQLTPDLRLFLNIKAVDRKYAVLEGLIALLEPFMLFIEKDNR